MRNVTERPEAVRAGVVKLVGTNRARIAGEVATVFTRRSDYTAMSRATNPYGDGKAAQRIAAALAGRKFEEWDGAGCTHKRA